MTVLRLWKKLTENSIQLILIDVMMPKLDGLSTMMKIRATENIPILVLSAKSEDTDKVLGLSMGADDYITKPYNPMELVARGKKQPEKIYAAWRYRHGKQNGYYRNRRSGA